MQDLRILSQVFSPPMFKRIVRDEDIVLYQKQTEKYFKASSYDSNLEVIRALYKLLQKKYRCEYVYKNNLFLKLIKEHSLKTTFIFNEFKIGGSKADLVMLNGTVRVFEIKTELDDFSKLSKQLSDYRKFADEVSIVTDEKYAEKLKIEYGNTNIGIIALNARNKLQTIKEAYRDTSSFDFDTIFKLLRKQEYLEIVADNFAFVPDVPNTQIFQACYKLLGDRDIIDFQKQAFNKIKERKSRQSDLLQSSNTPKELKHICNSLDFNDLEYLKLYNFLATKSVCINRI